MTAETGTVLITGGSRGIGLAAALVMGRQGWKVAIAATDRERLAAASDRLRGAGIAQHAVRLQVEDAGAWSAAVADVERALGPVSALVCNAGISPKRDGRKIPFEETDLEVWRRTIDVNLLGVLNGFRAVTPGMIRRGGGALVAVSSIAGRIAPPLGSAYYITSKAAVIGLVQGAALDLGRHNIRVNAIVPGRIETEMTAEAGAEFNRSLTPEIALRRLGGPEEVGTAIAFLCSPAASYVTGASLDVTGGWYIN